MFNRKKLDRERLEAYLVYLMLKVRPLITVCGIFLLVYALAVLPRYFVFGSALVLAGVYVVFLSMSFQVIVLTARFVAWLLTLGRRE